MVVTTTNGDVVEFCEPGKILVKFKASAEDHAMMQQEIARFNAVNGVEVIKVNRSLKIHSLRFAFDIPVAQMLDIYRSSPLVEWAEPNTRTRIAASYPNDTMWTEQSWYQELINTPEAWDTEVGDGTKVCVAVLDSGIDLDHPDLNDSLWHNPYEIPDNSIDDDGNGYVDDYYGYDFVGQAKGSELSNQPADSNPDVFWDGGSEQSAGDGLDNEFPEADGYPDDGVTHGTFVAGIIAARTSNGKGVAGVAGGWGPADGVRLMAVRIFDPEGGGWLDDMLDGITYAVDQNVTIINLSGGTYYNSSALEDAVDYAWSNDVPIIAATGNDNNLIAPMLYPAYYNRTIAVGASDRSDPDGRASFSNYGDATRRPDVVAPGVDIASTRVYSKYDADINTSLSPGQATYHVGYDGTSFSTPLACGVAALMYSQNPNMTVEELRVKLHLSALNLPDDPDDGPDGGPDWDGYGMVQADQGIIAANWFLPTLGEWAIILTIALFSLLMIRRRMKVMKKV